MSRITDRQVFSAVPRPAWFLFSTLVLFAALAGSLRGEEGKEWPARLTLKDGDVIAWLGSTVVEREQSTGYWELALARRFLGINFRLRNLGWSGDTVFTESRGGFGTAEDGFRELEAQLKDIRPTIVFVSYGANESFSGEAGLERFEAGIQQLLNMIKTVGANDQPPRVYLFSPTPQESLEGLPSPEPHNADLKRYSAAIQKVAKSEGHVFVDLYQEVEKLWSSSASQAPSPGANGGENRQTRQFTENGLHFTPWGYWALTEAFEKALGLADGPCIKLAREPGAKKGGEKFSGVTLRLCEPAFRDAITGAVLLQSPPLSLSFETKQSGNLRLLIHEEEAGRGSAAKWKNGEVPISIPAEEELSEVLRQKIIYKNLLYFHAWRPQNVTYLFGFRKHEQGNNAKDVAELQMFAAEQEQEIAALRKSRELEFQLLPVK